ncbi:MAG: thioredoxin family protein [Planctomycetota bacterium]
MVCSVALALILATAGGTAGVAGASVRSAVAPAVSAGEPEVFSAGGLDADRRASIDAGKVHVVYATASWCPPCRKMKTTTWVDDGVVEWLDANAVVTPLDVDAFQSDAARLRVRAMPTIMVFKGSTEISRTVGYQSPAAFRGWLESSTGLGIPAEGTGETVRVTRATVQDKLVQAQDAVKAGRLDEAAETYAWLWDNMRQDRLADELRRGSLADEITELLEKNESARTLFVQRRDAIGSVLPPSNADEGTLLDWLTLNEVLDEERLSGGWVGSAIGDRGSLSFMRKHQRVIRPMLTKGNMWQDAATVVNNPFAAARLEIMELKKAQRRSGETGLDEPTLAALADLYAIAMTLDRGGFGERVANLVLHTEDTPAIRRALVARAIDADVTKPALLELIADDGSDEAESLRVQIDR